jgi:4-hydroxybenzoate polyprenyltransferase
VGVGSSGTRRIEVAVDSLLRGSTLALECLIDAARRSEMDPSGLPYREEVLATLRREAAAGTEVVLSAPGREEAARRIAAHLGFRSGTAAGAEIWAPEKQPGGVSARALWRTLRPYQWLKNTLVFLPFLLAHEFDSEQKWRAAFLLFAAFSLCASASYTINDILDRRQDRAHGRKSRRPIASGEIPLALAVWIPLPLLALAAVCCLFLPPACGVALAAYFGATLVYSTAAKKLIMADVLLLALLYLWRLMAGSFATDNKVSHWLMAFAVTLFLALALWKRVSELMTWKSARCQHPPGRGYRAEDAPVLEAMAVASGFLACLIMVLYIQSPEILRLYRRPEYLWLGVVALLYWLGRLAIYAHRGECPDDPLLFAVQDRTTLAVFAAAAALAWMAL